MSAKTASYLIGIPLLLAAVLYALGDASPACIGARVLLTGATVFGAKLECGLDAFDYALKGGGWPRASGR